MNVAIILAAGQGKRMKAGMNKQFLLLGGKTVLEHTLCAFDCAKAVDGYILVAHERELEYVQEMYQTDEHPKLIKVVVGGKERQDSVWEGIKALPDDCEYVLIHDGARPFINNEVIMRALESAIKNGSGIAGVGVKDTIKQCDENGVVIQTLSRNCLWSVQTPQVFRKDFIAQAYEKAFAADYYGTDDASLVEFCGEKVQMVEGDYDNIKITTQEDLAIGENILKRRAQQCE